MQLRVENWNGNLIRFVGENDDWMAVGFDVARALGYVEPHHAITNHVDPQDKRLMNLGSVLKQAGTSANTNTATTNNGGSPVMIVISEYGIYQLVFSSKMPEAKEFRRWVYSVIQRLRKRAGLESYQAFQMLDKQVQQQAMERLDAGSKVDYIKANTIADKAVSNMYGLPKMIKKAEMTEEMKRRRGSVLNDTVDLMNTVRRFGLNDVSVSRVIYDRASK